MPTREHAIPHEERGPADGTLGQNMAAGGLRLSADQIDHLHEKDVWKPKGGIGIPWRMLAVVLAGIALILIAWIVLFLIGTQVL